MLSIAFFTAGLTCYCFGSLRVAFFFMMGAWLAEVVAYSIREYADSKKVG